MSEQQRGRRKQIRGTIRSRLLLNALVDPDEAAARLPEGLRPHETPDGTVVGCCLLEIEHIRPSLLPASMGRTMRAAAHRISAEWEDESGETTVGVHVSMRHTDSRLGVALGGRWFPGVHERARIDVSLSHDRLLWTVLPVDDFSGFPINASVTVPSGRDSEPSDAVGVACLDASVGLSPNHHGVLEGARMEPDHHNACEVIVEQLDSTYLSGFVTARPSRSYLMRDIGVTWTPTAAPPLDGGAPS